MKLISEARITADWLKSKSLQRLFDILTDEGNETLVVGGAVRNSLLGTKDGDVDLATVFEPQQMIDRLQAAGEKAVPTGFDHGTVTAVIDGKGFEVTTLREDIETDGRHAIVRFGTDWVQDAKRRDFTMNALYCNRDGEIFDPLGGYDDLKNGDVKFIGDAGQRIEEDALRILRFYRFFAWYGSGRPDAAGLKACAARKGLIENLSVERIWMELKKLLAAPDPGRALLWMRTTGVLSTVLPESEKWGIDFLPELIRQERAEEWNDAGNSDPLLRLMAIIPPRQETVEGLTKRLSMSNAERDRLLVWSQSKVPVGYQDKSALAKFLYVEGQAGTLDAMKLEAMQMPTRDADPSELHGAIKFAENWTRPKFPLSGKDLSDKGIPSGPHMGKRLAALETRWVESGFSLTRETLLEEV